MLAGSSARHFASEAQDKHALYIVLPLPQNRSPRGSNHQLHRTIRKAKHCADHLERCLCCCVFLLGRLEASIHTQTQSCLTPSWLSIFKRAQVFVCTYLSCPAVYNRPNASFGVFKLWHRSEKHKQQQVGKAVTQGKTQGAYAWIARSGPTFESLLLSWIADMGRSPQGRLHTM